MSRMTIFFLEEVTHLNESMICGLIMIYNGSIYQHLFEDTLF